MRVFKSCNISNIYATWYSFWFPTWFKDVPLDLCLGCRMVIRDNQRAPRVIPQANNKFENKNPFTHSALTLFLLEPFSEMSYCSWGFYFFLWYIEKVFLEQISSWEYCTGGELWVHPIMGQIKHILLAGLDWCSGELLVSVELCTWATFPTEDHFTVHIILIWF